MTKDGLVEGSFAVRHVFGYQEWQWTWSESSWVQLSPVGCVTLASHTVSESVAFPICK